MISGRHLSEHHSQNSDFTSRLTTNPKNFLIEDDIFDELIENADPNGNITMEIVAEILDEELDDADILEVITYKLAEVGITVRKNNRRTLDEEISAEFDPEETLPGLDTGEGNPVQLDDPVGLYFRQMAQEPLLTAAEEISLAKRIAAGRKAQQYLEHTETYKRCDDRQIRRLQRTVREGQAARQRLGRANTRLVVSIAKRYMGQGLPFPDLIQEGNVGLMRAVDKYDPGRGNRFSTYATWWIRQAITRALAQKTRTIRIPLHMMERIRQMYRTTQALEQRLGHIPTPEDIAEHLDTSPDMVRDMMDLSRHAIALERPIGDDNESELGDFIEDLASPCPVEAATQHLLEETIEEALSELTPRQSHILRLRFGLNGEEPHTLEEIANKFCLSRERIRQLEKDALRRLRHPSVAHNLRDYLR